MIIAMLSCIIALFWFLRKPEYRLLIPSTMNYLIWGVTCILIYSSTVGWMATGEVSVSQFDKSIKFICGMLLTSFLGFNLAHEFTSNRGVVVYEFNIEYIDWLLKRFKWLLYVCLISGLINLIFLIVTIGFNNLGDYRIAAISTNRSPLVQLIRTIGGHAGVLGFFYLAIYGYKQAIDGIKIWQLIIYILMYGMNNIAIAGRAWIALSMVPYVIGFLFGHRSRLQDWHDLWQNGLKKLLLLGIIMVGAFTFIGTIRNNGESTDESRPIDKLLYLTDGSRVANIVMNMYPDGTFPLEYGQCEFLNGWYPSPMKTKYYDAISNNIGLTVTVPSTIPWLYFDFGFTGGILMWGVYCFVLELICLNQLQKNSVLAFLVSVQLTRMLYQAPIGEIFAMSFNTFEWFIILYIFRKRLFAMPDYEQL